MVPVDGPCEVVPRRVDGVSLRGLHPTVGRQDPPVKFSRISSRYNLTRFHPILKRTGISVALILTALGVNSDDIMQDYRLSNVYFNIPKATSDRNVAQLVAHYVRDVGVGRSSRLIPTYKAWFSMN